MGYSMTSRAAAGGTATVPTLLRVAWLSIALGVVMEAILLLTATGFGFLPTAGAAAADLVKQVSWSVIVCAGLALGTAVSKLRIPLMGLLGLVSGPFAFGFARSLHQGTAEALETVPATPSTSSVLLIGLVKGVEYGCLGAAIAWVGTRSWGGLLAHVVVGLLVGFVFGGVIVASSYAAQPTSTAELVSHGVNEITLPVGCALVLFTATLMAKREARSAART